MARQCKFNDEEYVQEDKFAYEYMEYSNFTTSEHCALTETTYHLHSIHPYPLFPKVRFQTTTYEPNAFAVDSKIAYKRPANKSITYQPGVQYRDPRFINPIDLQHAQKWEYLDIVKRWLPGEGTWFTHNDYRYLIGPPIHLGINGHIHYCYKYESAKIHASFEHDLIVEIFAAKIIPNTLIFKREIGILQNLQHFDHITNLEGIIESEFTTISIMELAQADGYNFFMGTNITKYHGWNFKKIAVREHFAKMVLVDIVNGIDCMHQQNVLHCDLKPPNLLLFIFMTTHSVDKGGIYIKSKLTDFGHSHVGKTIIAKKPFKSGMAQIGTAGYVSPELFVEGRECDYKIDIWSLGLVLFAILMPRVLMFGSYASLQDLEYNYKRLQCVEERRRFLWWSDFEKLSLEVRDLIFWMTRWNAKDRPSCDEIRKHPWFCKEYALDYAAKDHLKHIDVNDASSSAHE